MALEMCCLLSRPFCFSAMSRFLSGAPLESKASGLSFCKVSLTISAVATLVALLTGAMVYLFAATKSETMI